MDSINHIWGIHNDIGIGEVSARAIVMFVILLALVRIFGMRPFGKTDPFDILVTILLGAVAARGIVGASPFLPVVAACLVIIITHRILAKLTFYSRKFGRLAKGMPLLLYADGQMIRKNMAKANISENDIYEELRYELHMNSLEGVAEIYFERNGHLSFILEHQKS